MERGRGEGGKILLCNFEVLDYVCVLFFFFSFFLTRSLMAVWKSRNMGGLHWYVLRSLEIQMRYCYGW